MTKHRPQRTTLKKPPVVMAVCQISFDENSIDLTKIKPVDTNIQKYLPKKQEASHTNVSVAGPPPIGVSKMNGEANRQITGYTYFAKDQKYKLMITKDSLIFVDENPYQGWDHFVGEVKIYLDIFNEFLGSLIIRRVSVRFINNFTLGEFEDPTEYFKTMVSTTEDVEFSYPVVKYGFSLTFDVPNSNIFAQVKQGLHDNTEKGVDYVFDIDVIEQTNLMFDTESITSTLDNLRDVKNNIFFENITDKTIQSCNI